ncbi:hypothetical protein pb186bvf_011280 [Paramecium bursaria]
MEFVVKVGMDGYQFNVENSTLLGVQEIIQAQTKIDIKNQLLLSKKGVIVEDLQMFGGDSQLLQTTQFQDSKTYSIYLFDQSENYDPNTSSNYPQQKIEYKWDLKQIALSDKDKDVITGLNPNLLNQEKIFYQHLLNIRSKHQPYQARIKQFEKLGQEIENQVQSFEVLLKMISLNYQNTKLRKNDVFKKCKESIDRNSQTVKKFDESLENLKKIELHPSLQTESQKFLSDIYYKPESMHKWKNGCLNTSQAVKSKIEKTSQYLKKLKLRIKDERNTTITNCINSYKQHQNQFSQTIQESKQLIQTVVQSNMDEYNELRKQMVKFSEDVDDCTAIDYLSNFDIGQEQIKAFEDSVSHLGDHLEKVNKSIEIFTKLKINNQNQLQVIFKNMRGYNKEFEGLVEKIKSSEEEVDKMEKDFSYLLNPVQLPQAYQQALLETSRRREFRDVFEKKLKTLMGIIDIEKEKRRKFLNIYGRILPSDFFGQLKNLAPQIQVLNAFADAELPNIIGLHTDHYKKKVDTSQIDQLKQQIEDLTLQNKQTHQYYQTQKKQGGGLYNDLLLLTAKNSMKLFINRAENKLLAQDIENTKPKENDSKVSNLKQEYNETLVQQKKELEQFKIKTQKLEQDLSLKQTELEKLNQSYVELVNKSEQLSSGQQQLQQIQLQLTQGQQQLQSAQQQISKLKEELTKYMSKCENLELNLIQKNSEISKLQQQFGKDKSQYLEQIQNGKQQYQEVLKKLQQLQSQSDGYVRECEQTKLIYQQETQEYCQKIQNLLQDQETLKQKQKQAELDRDNKQLELEKQIKSYNQLLEGFIEKSDMLDQLDSTKLIINEKEQQLKEEIKLLCNQLENQEMTIQQKNLDIQNLKNSEKQVQLDFEDFRLQSSLEKVQFEEQIQILNGQVQYLNEKQRIDISIIQQKLQLADQQYIYDLSSIKVGRKSIFIPVQNGVYVPLILKGIQPLNISDDSTQLSIEQQNKNHQLRLECLQCQYKDFIIETGLMIIAEVTQIQETEVNYLVDINQPSYIIGFEESDIQIRNFTL